MSKIIKKYSTFLESRNLTESQDSGFTESDARIDEANRKVRKALVWLSINETTYAELLTLLTIYASYDLNPKTMCTDGQSVAFHPDFVLEQSDAAIRFVLCHEVLHCIMEHHSRRGNRHPVGWNIACDYAINPIICEEDGKPATGFEWPIMEGKKAGLYEKEYDGMTAEKIFEILKENASLDEQGKPASSQQGPMDEVKDSTDVGESKMPKPAGQLLQQGEDEGEGQDKGEGKGEAQGEVQDKGEAQGKKKEKGKESKSEPSLLKIAKIGDKVRLSNGNEAVVKKVFSDGSIEI